MCSWRQGEFDYIKICITNSALAGLGAKLKKSSQSPSEESPRSAKAQSSTQSSLTLKDSADGANLDAESNSDSKEGECQVNCSPEWISTEAWNELQAMQDLNPGKAFCQSAR